MKILEIVKVMIKGGYTEKQKDNTSRMRLETVGNILGMVSSILLVPMGMICLTGNYLYDVLISIFIPVVIIFTILGVFKVHKSDLRKILFKSFVISIIIFSCWNYLTELRFEYVVSPKIETMVYNNPLEKKLVSMYTKTYYQYAKKYNVSYKIYFTKKYPAYLYGYTDTTRKLIIVNYNYFVKIKDKDFLTDLEYSSINELMDSRNNTLLHELSHVVQIRKNGYCDGHGKEWLIVAKSMKVDTRNYEHR